jgi:hypothetical protein
MDSPLDSRTRKPNGHEELTDLRGNLTTDMDVRDNSRYVRPAALVVILLLHGSLIVLLLRAKIAYKARPESSLFSTVFHINPDRPLRLPPPQTSGNPARSPKDFIHHLLPDSSTPSVDISPLENQAPDSPSTIDWFAEAQRSAAEIAGREEPNRTAVSPPPPAGLGPWDPHPHLLETTGHGLRLRIPVPKVLRIVDHCFSDIDSGQTPYGPEARLQLGCVLKKEPARGDLFDSLRKSQPPK